MLEFTTRLHLVIYLVHLDKQKWYATSSLLHIFLWLKANIDLEVLSCLSASSVRMYTKASFRYLFYTNEVICSLNLVPSCSLAKANIDMEVPFSFSVTRDRIYTKASVRYLSYTPG